MVVQKIHDTNSNKETALSIASKCLPWLDVIAELWRLGRKIWEDATNVGMYEVLHHEATLEIHDPKGKKATLTKHQKVRYLQNNIVAYQDLATGDGDVLQNYRCSPGIAVDQYKPAEITYILISLRETKQKGDVDNFHISWEARDTFNKAQEWWATRVNHRTKSLKLQIIFPNERPPRHAKLKERMSRRNHNFDLSNIEQRADGKWLIVWETSKVRLYERYLLEWGW